jgi:hypothetical protein
MAFVVAYLGMFNLSRGLLAGMPPESVILLLSLSTMELGVRSIAPAVASVWVTLAMDKRERIKADWIEMAGRLVGLGWFVLFVATAILSR